MKKILLLTGLLLMVFSPVLAQKKMNLNNVVVTGLFDKKDQRFQMEIFVAERLIDNGIKTTLSLNYLKEGANIVALASDSVQQKIQQDGYDKIILVSVRGFESKFKPVTTYLPLAEELELGHLFPMFREEASNMTFEFKFYEGTKMIGYDMIKVSSPSEKGMFKKLSKALNKRIKKYW